MRGHMVLLIEMALLLWLDACGVWYMSLHWNVRD